MSSSEAPKVVIDEASLKTYLSSRRAVVIDTGQSTARSIRKFLMQFGAKSDSVVICETFADAKKALLASPTHLLFADLKLGTESGLDLIASQEELFPNRLEVSTVVLSGDPSNASMGMITEANVDSLLIKPFNFQSFKDALSQALANKVAPSPYWVSLEKGKALLKKEEFTEAITVFEATKALDPVPTLAFFYLGHIHALMQNFDQAIQSYEDGLVAQPKDYRCLLALFDIQMKSLKFRKAYETAKRIHEEYPVSTRRILDLVKLSVYVKKFSDIVDYYHIFKKIEQREADLSRVVVAGMLVCSKYFWVKGQTADCIEVLTNAAKVSLQTELLRVDVLRYFVETGHLDGALDFLQSLPPEVQDSPAAQLLYMEVIHDRGSPTDVLTLGMKLLHSGISSARLYELLIEGSKKSGRNPKAIELLIEEAKAKYPSEAETFMKQA